MSDCAKTYESMPASDKELWSMYLAYIGLREYCLARDMQSDADDLAIAFDRSYESMNQWLNSRPEAVLFLKRATSALQLVDKEGSVDERFVYPETCKLNWSTLACYMYGVSEPTGDILKATEDGNMSWMDVLICPDRIKNEHGPRDRGWPVWIKLGMAAGIVGTSVWMVWSLTKK